MKKVQVTQKRNPIFALLNRISNKLAQASEDLVKSLQFKTTTDSKEYFLLNLPDDGTHFEGFRRRDHHISVFKNYRDNHFGLSAYHYTATFSNNRSLLYVHAFFDQYGVLQNILVQDEKKLTIVVDKNMETWLSKISISSTVLFMTEIFNMIDHLSSQHEADLQVLNREIDRLSRIVFGNSATSENLNAAYDQYMNQVRMYIEARTRYNEICFEPDHGAINLLQGILVNFQLPKPTQKSKAKPSKPKSSTPPPLATEDHTFQTNHSVIASSPQTDTKKVMAQVTQETDEEDERSTLRLFEEAEKIDRAPNTTASSICHQNRLVLECFAQYKVFPANKAIDLCIMQNRVLAKAKIFLKLAVSKYDIDSVIMLLPLVKVINQDLIEYAALSGNARALSLLLEKYRGPKFFMCKIHNTSLDKVTHEKNFEINMSTLLLTEDKLPTACLKILINYGCDPDVLTLSGYSLLQRAVEMKDLERVQLLLAAEVDVNQQHFKGTLSGFFEIETKANKNKVRSAAEKSIKAISNLTTDTGVTAAMIAARGGDVAILKCLVEHPCDLGIVDLRGFTVLGYGLISKEITKRIPIKEEIVKYLVVDCGLDIHAPQGPEGKKQTALHFAVQYGNLENLRILLNYGADPNILRPYTDPTQRYSSFFSACIRNKFDHAAFMLIHSKIPISSEEVKKIIALIQEKQPEALTKIYELLNLAPYIQLDEVTTNDGKTGIQLMYLDTVADRIRAGLSPEIEEGLPAPIAKNPSDDFDDLSDGEDQNVNLTL